MDTCSVIASDKVEGADVYDSSGDKLGSIDDLMIDRHSGHVRYAVMKFGGFFGIGSDRYPIPWSMLHYDDRKDAYVVPLDKGILDKAPKYDESAVPLYDEDYGRHVSSYYGAPP